MIRSNAERSTTRSLTIGKARARQGSRISVSPSRNDRMCSWHTVDPRAGPWGSPSIRNPHVPQMPSRQSESNAIGSSPRAISPSLTTSSISRNDMSGDTPSATYSTSLPGLSGPGCLQTFSVIRISVSWQLSLVAALRRLHVLEVQRFPVKLGLHADAFELPRSDVLEMLVVAQRFAVGCLALLAEVPAAGLAAMQR